MTTTARAPLRALSFWQPVASLIAHGVITVETRKWKTAPGPLVICAAKSREGMVWCDLPDYQDALRFLKLDPARLPFGAAVAVADVYDVVSTNEWTPPQGEWGGWDDVLVEVLPNRWAFLLDKVRLLTEPVPVTGRQGIWTVPEPAAALVRERTPYVQSLEEQWAEAGDIDFGLGPD